MEGRPPQHDGPSDLPGEEGPQSPAPGPQSPVSAPQSPVPPPPAPAGEVVPDQEPPGGWDRPVPQAAAAPSAYAIKYPLGRAIGFSILSFGLWSYYWFYRARKVFDAELGHGKDDAALHTAGLLVPILNFFIVFWLWRDVNEARSRVGLSRFSEGGYLVGSIFLAPVFYALALQRVNEYWDVRTQGLATDSPVTGTEKVLVGIGIGIWLLFVLMFILIMVIAIVAGSSSS